MSGTKQRKFALNKAMKLYDQGRFKAAIAAFRKLPEQEKHNYDVLFYLALSLYETNQFQPSLRLWERLLKIGPRQKNVHLNMGCAYQGLGRNDLAIRCFKKELKINPLSGETLYSLGTLYYNTRKYKLATPYLALCYGIKHPAGRIKVAERLADCYFKTEQLEKEVELYEDWLRSKPKDTWGLNNLGAALMQIGEYNRALLFLKRAAKIDPKDKKIIRNIKKTEALRKHPLKV